MARKPDEGLKRLDGRKKLSPNELKLMRYIWEFPDGVSSEKIYAHFTQPRGTISTMLNKLSEKRYVVNHQEGLHHFYRCLVTRVDYENAVLHQQLKEVLGGDSFVHLVAAFCGKEKLTKEQKERAQELLKEIRDDSENGAIMDGDPQDQ